jgi:dTDP-4-amino-4,6-dideoxygalactose transaminase
LRDSRAILLALSAQHTVSALRETFIVRFALRTAGIHPGDTAATVPDTFITTTEAISQFGARFDFVNVNERALAMDPRKLGKYSRPVLNRTLLQPMSSQRTGSVVTAVNPVGLHGRTADILDLAGRYRCQVIGLAGHVPKTRFRDAALCAESIFRLLGRAKQRSYPRLPVRPVCGSEHRLAPHAGS